MIHDTLKDRQEYIQFLKDQGQYNPNASANEMQIGHTQYWTMKDKEKAMKSKKGFTLVELLVSIVAVLTLVIGIVIVGAVMLGGKVIHERGVKNIATQVWEGTNSVPQMSEADE
jgi:hypothetical protein